MTDATPLIFVGIGVGRYDDPSFESLPQAFPGVERIGRLLERPGSLIRIAPEDPTEQQARDYLDTHLPVDGLDNGTALVVVWAGHALPVDDPALHLIGRRTRRGTAPLIKASDLAGIAARCGARQILIVLDACFTGKEGIPALAVAVNVQAKLAAANHTAWVGVLTATSPLERARDGAFGERLARLLEEGPRDPLLQRRWSPHERHISLESLADALMREWDISEQEPTFQRAGVAHDVLLNPRYDSSAPDAIVEHLLLAARGAEPGEEASYFTGRVEPIDRVVAWLNGEEPGVFVVTGPAGSGKSAIVGRIVSLSDPAERKRILAAGPLEHTDPGARSVHAHVHARGLTMERLVEEIDRRLVSAGVLVPAENGTRNRGELLGALERADTAPVIAIDGLDEAGTEAWTIAEDVVRLLRTHARFLVSTREMTGSSLIETLQPDAQVDLGDDHYADQTTGDVIGYTTKRLNTIAPEKMNAEAVGGLLARSAATSGEGAFLLARIVTAQLRETPIDTTIDGWERQLSTAVQTALERDLKRIDPLTRDGQELPHAGRELLSALAWGYGAGMPRDIWAIAATGLSPTQTVYTSEDVLWLLENAGRYIIEAGESRRAVYRLAHQRLTDHFLPSRRIGHIEPQAARLAQHLTAHYIRLLDAGARPQEPAYLWHYTWRHATDGGVPGVDALRPLAARSRNAFVPDLAMALNDLAIRYGEVGRRAEAIAPAEEAVELYRTQAAESPAYLPDLAMALNNLGVRYSELGRHAEAVAPTEEAVQLYRTQAAENPAYLPDLADALSNRDNLPDLAMALNTLAIRYGEVGRRAEAVAPAEEAVEVYRRQAAEDPAYLPALASALGNLGVRYSEVGRRAEAIAPAEEAVELRRAQTTQNPAYLPDLAMALNNLANHYSEVGRRAEAIAPAEEAVELYRTQAAENPAHFPDLAMAVNNLANHYSEVGRRAEAIAPAEEAVALYRTQAAESPAYLPDLAMALNNLGVRYSKVGRHAEAIAPAEEAVELYRTQAAENPSHFPNLAGALGNLGVRYSGVGRHAEAVAPAEEAVELRRAQATQNPAYLPDLAMALNNLGVRYNEVGRHAEAVAPAEEAVELYRTQAAENPAYLPDLASALGNLGVRYSELGRHAEAVAPAEEAVELRRAQATQNPAYLPDLAMALNNLANHYSEVERRAEAVAPAEEAVELRRAQATQNPAYLPDLAMALNNLGARYGEVGREEEIDAAWDRALSHLASAEAKRALSRLRAT